MLKEEVLYKGSRTGTTAFYFVPNVTAEQVSQLEEPAYVIFNNLNVPIFYATYSGKEIWKLEDVNSYNLNVQLSALTSNYLTGYSVSQTFNTLMSDNQKTIIRQRFNDNVTSTITAQTQVAVNYPTYVFFKEQEIDDIFANIKLSRSYDTLDTLGIYNKPINSIPTQEAKTGILFGKLEAIQTLKDEAGNNIKIPLRNVPIGIFNPSDEFPSPVSLDNNGDRFFMNLKESSIENQYFDSLAFEEDQKFLKSASQFLTVPQKFKFITITNDNGEFVLYDVPIGNQTVVFEVDLFKQGLTKDEIILNNFPFPTSDDSNIGEFPCYYFNQVPVDVVSAWGTNQTGYTELNIQASLDLRKWATYIFPPASYGNEKLETTLAKNTKNTFKIQVRDMTNKKFASKAIEVAQIPNDLDRRDGAKYLWFNELLGQRQQIEFFKFGCHVIKLPANLYDPNGFRTDSGGTPTLQRGLWLAAYQLKCAIDKNICSRTTGGYKDDNTGDFWSHFDVNFFPGAAPADAVDFSGIGRFPYEKPWTINYPEPYKIPPKPVKKRFDYGTQRTFQGPFILEEPAYEDGDLIGNIVSTSDFPDGLSGGFGIQATNGVWFPNQISYVATKDYMYKYEKDVRWNETYANGYEQLWDQNNLGPYVSYPQIAGMSSVQNGEKYQRVECGYGYFMKYVDWPRVYRIEWAGDIYFQPDGGTPNVTPSGTYGSFKSLRNWRHNTFNIDDQNYAFAFNQLVNAKVNKNTIDIYRVVNSGVDNILIPENFVIPTGMMLSNNYDTSSASGWLLRHSGSAPVNIKTAFNGGPVYYDDGNGTNALLPQSAVIKMYPGGYFTSQNPASLSYVKMILPGNDAYDTNTNKYLKCSYTLEAYFGNIAHYAGATSFSIDATLNYHEWFIGTLHDGSSAGIVSQGLTDDFNYGGATYPVPGNASRRFYKPAIVSFNMAQYHGFYVDSSMPNASIIF